MISHHRQEIQQLQQEVVEKIPKISAAAVEKLESQYRDKMTIGPCICMMIFRLEISLESYISTE